MRILPALAVMLSVTSCAFLPAPNPMPSLRDDGVNAKCLVVFLPGAGDSASHFEKHGFIAAMRARKLSVDLVSANATMGYYMNGVLVDRLDTDVVSPALAKKYEQTWLIGMSMGGMGTLFYSHERVDQVTGVLALAPFLGDEALIKEIRDAGSLRAWKGPAKVDKLENGNYQRELWRWLQGVTGGTEKGPNIYLGWGTEDRLGRSAEVLAAALPKEHVFTVPGAHKWVPWLALLNKFLDDSDFARACAE